MTSVANPSNGSRCRGRNRAGFSCQRRAVKDGYCTTHHPTEGQDMKALGKLGGRAPKMTQLRRAAAEQDDNLREQARQVLSRALAGETVDPAQLRAAQSLYSFKADQPPPRDREFGEYSGPLTPDGRRPVGLADVLAFGLQAAPEATEAMIAEAREAAGAADTPASPGSFSRNPVSSSTSTVGPFSREARVRGGRCGGPSR
jgi:hypothetical protein